MGDSVRSFRVYNGVLRPGVTFPFGSLRLEWPTVVGLIGWALGAIALVGVSLMIGGVLGVALAVIFGLVGLIGELTLLVWVRRLKFLSPPPAQLRESTHLRLLKESLSEPWYENFASPDEPRIGWNTSREDLIYRNY